MSFMDFKIIIKSTEKCSQSQVVEERLIIINSPPDNNKPHNIEVNIKNLVINIVLCFLCVFQFELFKDSIL